MTAKLNYAVRELHIDLLFLEEFYSSNEFRHWFIKNTLGSDYLNSKLLRTEHSVFELERESDLEIALEGPDGEFLFLIENKIKANFQKNQAIDYKNRAFEYIRREKCSEAFTILMAPHDYIQMVKREHPFDYYISFERVMEFFETQEHLGERIKYKIQVLKRAIKKAGFQTSTSSNGKSTKAPTEVSTGITLFWENYWKHLSSRIPELHMPKPTAKGPASTFIGLGKNILPSHVIIYHKFVHGFVDLQFDSLGSKTSAFIQHFQNHIDASMTIQKAGKSAVVIRMEVPKINPHIIYDMVEKDVEAAQDAALCLQQWFQQHSDVWISFHQAN